MSTPRDISDPDRVIRIYSFPAFSLLHGGSARF
jgi:hypothetical protein